MQSSRSWNSLDLKLVRSSESRVTFCAAMCCMSPGPHGVWMLQTGHNWPGPKWWIKAAGSHDPLIGLLPARSVSQGGSVVIFLLELMSSSTQHGHGDTQCSCFNRTWLSYSTLLRWGVACVWSVSLSTSEPLATMKLRSSMVMMSSCRYHAPARLLLVAYQRHNVRRNPSWP